MDIQIINEELLIYLHKMAEDNGRLRFAFDLRTTPEDGSQRMLNTLQVGTHVPIHRHIRSSETNICIEGCIEVVFYEKLPNMIEGGTVHVGENAIDETAYKEITRVRLSPREKRYGIQIPPMVWHNVRVLESSTIFEAKDGAYNK